MPKIFISHSSKDNDFAAKLADALRERGAEVWIDLADIPAGMKWSTAIQQGLNWAELMLLIITPDSMVSVNVEDEWQYYIDKKKLIVPIRWLPSDVHFQLQRLQYVDFHERNFEAALAKLGKELARSDFELLSPTVEKPNLRQIETDGQTDVPNLTPAQSQTPKGKKPASTSESYKDIRQSPTIIKPNWVGKVIPEPFDWCVIPQGHVILEPTPSEGGYVKVRKKFLVPEFKMARYPITNAQFEAFAG